MQFVSFFVDPIWLSIDVYYGYNVTELQSPIVLMDYDTKIELLEKISELKYVGSISDKFGEALERAQTRAYSGQDVIILMAVQTFSSLSTWVKSYQENKVNAHLVHFGVSTTKVDIAQLTRYGSSNFVPNVINNRAMSAYSWAVNTLQSVYESTRTHRAKIFEQSIIQNSSYDVNKTGTFYLDSPASRLLVSLYYDDENEAINVRSFTLTQPNGLRNNTTDLAIIKKDFLTFTLESALEPLPQGLWRFEIICQRSSSLTDKRLDIWAESANSSQIQLKTWNSALDRPNQQPLDFTKAPVGLYAQLTQNNKPIRGANVTAFVYVSDSGGSTSSLLAEIPLMDEGISDVTSGDGIYSGFMIKPSNSSFSYSVGRQQPGRRVYSRQPTTGSVIPMSDPVPAAIQFNRFENGPSFQLTNLPTNGVDLIPPQRITDLTILSYDSSSRTAILGWTASKDNYGTGDYVTHYRLERSIGTRETVTKDYPSLAIVDGTVNVTVDVPSVNEGEYVKYRVQGRDSSFNYGEVSNVVSLAGPAPSTGGLSTAGLWAIIGTFIALVVINLIIVLIRCCCPVEAKRRKRQAQRKMRNLFSSNDTATRRQTEDTPVTRYQSPPPPVQSWTSSDLNRDGGDPPAVRRKSDSSSSSSDKVRPQQQPQVEVRQTKANPAPGSIQGSERIYFGREDIDRMTTGQHSEPYSERSDGAAKPRVYERPYKPNPVSSRPVSSQVTSKGFSYIHGPNNKPLSQSETNLYYTDVTLRPPVGPSTKSSPTNSYLSVFAEQRADVVQPSSAQSSLASTLRAGLRVNEEWRDSNNIIYTDPRFDGQSNGQSSFDPQLHPANQVGLPPALPTVPPPNFHRMYNSDAGYADDRSSVPPFQPHVHGSVRSRST
ncbi:hypothetical protein DAPPUDRAFT_317777 [Daphnia pulex]|uniref:Uncharacterized protein n=1 Tax=Daphnia pulex TaxID=6669 RepID=E9GGY0_DAPPU|nr:hypothetical protein DAPPUDRAFT_317777 [Daphnia pulex]|eukprot:EFX81284.1 hypothetical protein DAPPUDRAFT_317777 [Daphnia pulex]